MLVHAANSLSFDLQLFMQAGDRLTGFDHVNHVRVEYLLLVRNAQSTASEDIPTPNAPATVVAIFPPPASGLCALGSRSMIATLTSIIPTNVCRTASRVRIRTTQRTWMNRTMILLSVSTRVEADAAQTALTTKRLAAHEMITMFPLVPEKTVDHEIEAPKNERPVSAARLTLRGVLSTQSATNAIENSLMR